MSGLARLSQRLALQHVTKRYKSKSIFDTIAKEATRAETWPFTVGLVTTGVIIWSIVPDSKSETAKNSKFQQQLNGTYKHDHHH
eukprot:CAMPEP_0113697544 /NCGR_PEP_ID=MMETSP0038_2-20120614/22193_1 /TAXON_ID=2898 /ORGANISM="Cryptomonas paramecium" /LENGTH=83 /DNA_ID=CAMNT_0000620567 /DNA_START=25 /DNA_END=276 /DNA_ORIENTATION=+ /assembly_acc=CAM_ASM_000170